MCFVALRLLTHIHTMPYVVVLCSMVSVAVHFALEGLARLAEHLPEDGVENSAATSLGAGIHTYIACIQNIIHPYVQKHVHTNTYVRTYMRTCMYVCVDGSDVRSCGWCFRSRDGVFDHVVAS